MKNSSELGTPHDPQSDLWAAIRADYLAGVTAPVLAERYGVSVRTIRRHASSDSWRRSDRVILEKAPPWNRGPLDRDDAIERFPELEEVEVARSQDTFELLFDPDQRELRRFAFRRAAEAAALGQPAEAVTWMRLVRTLDQSGDRIEAESRPFRDEDYLRASYLRRLHADVASIADAQDHQPEDTGPE